MNEVEAIANLLAGTSGYESLPKGWKHPSEISSVGIGSQVFIKNLRSRRWEQGIVKDYWDKGRFLEVLCTARNQYQYVFTPEHIAVKKNI